MESICVRAFNIQQINEILNLVKNTSNCLRNYTMIQVLLGSGIRVDELVNLTVEDVEANSQTIMVLAKGKKYKKEVRKINKKCLKILTDYIDFVYGHLKGDRRYNKLYIFSTDGGKTHISVRTVQKLVKDLVNRAETIPPEQKKLLTAYSFRHSFALYALRSGINPFAVAKLLGHKSFKSTLRYTKHFEHQYLEDIEKHPFARVDIKIDAEKDMKAEDIISLAYLLEGEGFYDTSKLKLF